jgi:hypothetical protein
MDILLRFLKGISLKDWGFIGLVILAIIGGTSMMFSLRGCGSEARTIISTLIKAQATSDKLLVGSIQQLNAAHAQVLLEQQNLDTKLQELRQEYQKQLEALEQTMLLKDTEIRKDISTRLAERSKQLKDDYEKALADPETARDNFLYSLSLWDDLQPPGGGETDLRP